MLGSITLDLDPVDRGHSTVGGLGQEGLTGYGSIGRPGKYAKARYLKDSDSTRAPEPTGHPSLMFSKCLFFPLSDDLCRKVRRYLTPPQLTYQRGTGYHIT
ncbi:hypothetical protein M9H77_13740 [Catharanthus roseus]|uniref:Uncharacterized protein n=1 Tax=Catharanthus roseus TaxID=4058 RepID=A0ACC0BLA3_CATRO|nr:hypothetical protein M9H77_13740 [Catharanthus roseus]